MAGQLTATILVTHPRSHRTDTGPAMEEVVLDGPTRTLMAMVVVEEEMVVALTLMAMTLMTTEDPEVAR